MSNLPRIQAFEDMPNEMKNSDIWVFKPLNEFLQAEWWVYEYQDAIKIYKDLLLSVKFAGGV